MEHIRADQLVEENIKLVSHMINRYFRSYLKSQSYDDIFQEGCIGLLQAAKRFNPDLGFKFSTYASNTIYGTLRNYFRDKHYNDMQMTRSDRGLYRQYVDLSNKGYSFDEICAELGISHTDLNCVVSTMQPSYLNFAISDEDDLVLEDLIADSRIDIESEIVCKLTFSNIKGRRLTIAEYLSQGYQQKEIAKMLGLSKTMVCREVKELKKVVGY